MVWRLKDDWNDKAWGAYPSDDSIPKQVLKDPGHEILPAEGGRYLYRVCNIDEVHGSDKEMLAENGKDPSSNFGVLHAAEYPHLVSYDGGSVTPIVVDAVANGFNSLSPFVHAGVDPRIVWNKYGEKYRGTPRFGKLWLC